MSPLVWDLAHIAAYEELWLVHRHGGQPLSRPELAAMYDAFETPRAVRGDLPLLDRAQALEYLADVRERALGALGERRRPATECRAGAAARAAARRDDAAGDRARAAARPRPPSRARRGRPRPAATAASSRSRSRAAPCKLGAPADVGFAYDNERPRHRADVPAFRIGRTPITNATFLSFVEGGGYERRPWWSDEAWAWKEEYDITHPEGWARGPGGEWRRWTMDGWAPLDPDEPVVHVSWFEADAFARAHGARLPTEAEWEKAATWDQETGAARAFPWGDEPCGRGRARTSTTACSARRRRAPTRRAPRRAARWACSATCGSGRRATSAATTASSPTPTASTPRSSSATRYKVLRGGSWATRARVATPTFRNWDLPHRRQIFSGVRLAWDA